jgi:Protein of unknown function (DUF5672)
MDNKKDLLNITLIGVDCQNIERLKMAADICEKGFSFGSVKLLTSIDDTDPRVVKIDPIDSTIAYSDFCIKELWKYIDTDYALIFQHDGFILNPDAWTNEFLEYDYIGAPWYYLKNIHVGNGGFCLRSKKLMKLVGENYIKIGGNFHPEDMWICNKAKPFLESKGIKFAPREIANKFSKEGDERGIFWNGEFGFHGLKYTDISRWLEKNPEYSKYYVQKFDDFTNFMHKYPYYDGSVHVLRMKPVQLEQYKELSTNNKKYDCRLSEDLRELDPIQVGHKVVYRLFRISVKQVGIPTFERTVEKIEYFKSKSDLLTSHPNIKITPSFNIPKWKQKLVKIFGNFIFPNKTPYTLIFFKEI